MSNPLHRLAGRLSVSEIEKKTAKPALSLAYNLPANAVDGGRAVHARTMVEAGFSVKTAIFASQAPSPVHYAGVQIPPPYRPRPKVFEIL
jgi:hypothetical protein